MLHNGRHWEHATEATAQLCVRHRQKDRSTVATFCVQHSFVYSSFRMSHCSCWTSPAQHLVVCALMQKIKRMYCVLILCILWSSALVSSDNYGSYPLTTTVVPRCCTAVDHGFVVGFFMQPSRPTNLPGRKMFTMNKMRASVLPIFGGSMKVFLVIAIIVALVAAGVVKRGGWCVVCCRAGKNR